MVDNKFEHQFGFYLITVQLNSQHKIMPQSTPAYSISPMLQSGIERVELTFR